MQNPSADRNTRKRCAPINSDSDSTTVDGYESFAEPDAKRRKTTLSDIATQYQGAYKLADSPVYNAVLQFHDSGYAALFAHYLLTIATANTSFKHAKRDEHSLQAMFLYVDGAPFVFLHNFMVEGISRKSHMFSETFPLSEIISVDRVKELYQEHFFTPSKPTIVNAFDSRSNMSKESRSFLKEQALKLAQACIHLQRSGSAHQEGKTYTPSKA